MPNFKKDRSKFKMKYNKDNFPFKYTEPSPNKFLGKLARGIGKGVKKLARNSPIGLGVRALKGEFKKGGGAGQAGMAQGQAMGQPGGGGFMGRMMGKMGGPMGAMGSAAGKAKFMAGGGDRPVSPRRAKMMEQRKAGGRQTSPGAFRAKRMGGGMPF